jgi:lipase
MHTMSIPLHVHQYGPAGGPPLLAVHGVTGHGARWAAFAQQQLARYRVIAPDLRGHGRSTSLPPWTLEQHAADLLSVIDGYGLDAVPVLAHSFGGAVALHLHRLAPGRISKLVLLDPAVGLSPALALERAEVPQRRFVNQREAWEAQRYDWPTASDETVYSELAEHLEQRDGEWRFRYCAPAVATAWSEMTRTPVLPHPGTPTMVIRALREQYVSSAFISGCQLVLGSDFDLVDLDVGHMVYVERPEDTGELVNQFVAKG